MNRKRQLAKVDDLCISYKGRLENEQVILVNEKDEPVGFSEKLTAHEKGYLHRAVSVFIFNSKGKLLLQKRAATKYHGAGLWTNTCCTHPRREETSEECAHRRLKEEMGFDTDLEEKFSFIYEAEVENGLIENEFDHVFFGVHNGDMQPDPDEVEDHTFVAINDVIRALEKTPERYSVWFRIIVEKYRDHLIGMEHRQGPVGV